MNRRNFGKALIACSYPFLGIAASGEVTLYFVDGYHGGVRGHMPVGAWRDIMTRLQLTPEWKLCLDIEPASWRALEERDPQSYAQLQHHLHSPEPAPRIEMVGRYRRKQHSAARARS